MYFVSLFAKKSVSFYSQPFSYYIFGANGQESFLQPKYDYILATNHKSIIKRRQKPLWKNNLFSLYKKNQTDAVLMGNGWNDIRTWKGKPFRWTEDQASLLIDTEKDFEKIKIIISARSIPKTTKTADIYLNEKLVDTFRVTDQLKRNTSKVINLTKGRSSITLRVREGAQQPNHNEPRKLGIAIHNIEIAPINN